MQDSLKKRLILVMIFFTIFLDFFNLGLIYPIFTSLVFEGNGLLVPLDATEFYKNALFGFLITAFPFGQFLGAPVIGQLSDQFGRRMMLILSLIGTIITLFACSLGVYFASLGLLLLGRFAGGLMAGNMTLAYASLADFTPADEKVKNFALIPLATGLGFAAGPYLAGILANPDTHALAGPVLPFVFATFLAIVNLALVLWKFPETTAKKNASQPISKAFLSSVTQLGQGFQQRSLRPYFWILFLMISSNFVFVQFVGPLAIERFAFSVTEVGCLYANIGIAVTLGHLFLTRHLTSCFPPAQALLWSLFSLGVLLIALLFSPNPLVLHVLTFFVMLACAVAYTNGMTLVSNQAGPEQQGEVMGVAVSIQSCSEFLPAAILGLLASLNQFLPLSVAALFALVGCLILKKFVLTAPQRE